MYIEGLKIELELPANDANVSIISRNRRQLFIEKPSAGGWVFKHVRCSDNVTAHARAKFSF